MADFSIGPESHPWEPLEQAFLARVQASSSVSAAELWRLFAADRWFQQELEVRARRSLLSRVGRLDWLGDVKHEALLSFAKRLAKTPDLGVDLERVKKTFPVWISAILNRACGDAIRRLQRFRRLQLAALENVPDPRSAEIAELRIDVTLAIEALDEPFRTLLRLSALGFSIHEIADQLGLSYWETHRRLSAGLAQLGRRLTSYRLPKRSLQSKAPTDSSSTMSS